MQEIIEKLPAIITIVGTVIVWIRLFMRTSNKTIVDMVVEPRNTSMWDKFIEIVLLSSLLVLTFLIPMLVPDFTPMALNILMVIDLILFFASFIVILIYWVCSWFKQVKGKILTLSVVSNYLLAFLMPFILLLLTRDQAIKELKENYLYGFIAFFGLVIFHCILITFYPSVLRYFHKPEIKKYQLERIQSPHDILQSLYLLYMIDNERHVLSENPSINKIGDGPFFIYFPKENALIKYYK
jgi:hypothetical protein